MNGTRKICKNCGKRGHINKFCSEPITSYGIILINNLNNIPKYLFIQRRNTIGFIDPGMGADVCYHLCVLAIV